MARLIPAFDAYVQTYIRNEGFLQKKGGWYFRPGFKKGFNDLLGISHSTYYEGRSVSAQIGIHNTEVESIYRTLTGEKTHNRPLWLLSLNIGHLEPEGHYKDWYFNELSAIPVITKELFDDVRDYGYPFLKEYENIELLIRVYEHRKVRRIGIDRETQFLILPLLYLLSGQKEKGIELMCSIIQEGYQPIGDRKTFYNNYMEY